MAAWVCVRLDHLQSGLRLLPLFDAEGVATEGRLLVRIEKNLRRQLRRRKAFNVVGEHVERVQEVNSRSFDPVLVETVTSRDYE